MVEKLFANIVSSYHKIQTPAKGDFVVEDRYTFEIGGKNKRFAQLEGIDNAFLALDDIETGIGKKIPLWLFGFPPRTC